MTESPAAQTPVAGAAAFTPEAVRPLQRHRMQHDRGFVAALDQSGGSTPGALRRYGLDETRYADRAQMMDLIHQMRQRIIACPAFDDRILGAILFEETLDRTVEQRGTAEYLWRVKGIVPFVKVDKGLADEQQGVRLMAPMPHLDALLDKAVEHGAFGTKMRSVLLRADKAGVAAAVEQQFEIARRILASGLVPIIEPEVSIDSPDRPAVDDLLRMAIREHLDTLTGDDQVMLKLTLPDTDDYYATLVSHPRVLRVVALSGGYSRDDAVSRLVRQRGVIASFSRALTEGLGVDQTPEEFQATLDASIAEIYAASLT